MMQRRTLIKTGAAVALGAPGLSGLAQQSVTLKFHTFMAPQSAVYLTMHKAWMDKVEKDSGGRIKFEGYQAMQLGGTPVQLYDQAKDGVVDIVWTLPGNTAGRFPRTEVFELPFMMNNAEATSSVNPLVLSPFASVTTMTMFPASSLPSVHRKNRTSAFGLHSPSSSTSTSMW